MCAENSSCKPRFKGVENFLRRIAFNLGNSPSQTEVKIISCIPIDVTDLQQKILQLEKEIEEYSRRPLTSSAAKCNARVSVVHTALASPCLNLDSTPPPQSSHTNSKNPPLTLANSNETYSPSEYSVRQNCATYKLPKELKKPKGNNKGRTHLVYYTQTANSPFNYNTMDAQKVARKNDTSPRNTDALPRSYLADMVRKQYRPDRVTAELSDSTQFSVPVCRDMERGVSPTWRHGTDMCSCCHGHFHDLDAPRQTLTDYVTDTTQIQAPCGQNNMYYDTSLYDMVPVRERPKKLNNDDEPAVRKEPKNKINCIPAKVPEGIPVKPRFHPYGFNVAPVRMNNKISTRKKLAAAKLHKTEKRMAHLRKFDQQMSGLTSNTCSFDCGDVYMKSLYTKPRAQRAVERPFRQVLQKNAECLTISVNHTECQTASSKSVQLEPIPPDENKTEMTLNQIKSILQSVLTEVKTTAHMKQVEDKLTRDAVVQKGASQSNMQACSSLMNSYTYSPYDMNSYAACSRQHNTNQFSLPGHNTLFPQKWQNYPLFIQTAGRQCGCCYRHTAAGAQPSRVRHAATTATNTDAPHDARNKETEKLIKEIYKSIAINMDFPKKDTSTSENERSSDSSRRKFNFKCDVKPKRKSSCSVSDVGRKTTRDMWTTPGVRTPGASTPPFRSSVVSNTASTRMRYKSDRPLTNQRIDLFMKRKEPRLVERRLEQRPYVVVLPNATSSPSDEETDAPSSDPDSDATVTALENTNKKKEKTSIFQKVIKLFQAKHRTQKEQASAAETEAEANESAASDSDEYQTIYSHRSERPAKRVTYHDQRPRRPIRPHSKLSYSRYYMHRRDRGERIRQAPYMEQEYRRNWNESLAFHGDSPMLSSDRPLSSESDNRKPHPAYWRDCEARHAVVKPCPGPSLDGAVRNSTKSKPVAWLKKHKLGGLQCGEQWKKLILEG